MSCTRINHPIGSERARRVFTFRVVAEAEAEATSLAEDLSFPLYSRSLRALLVWFGLVIVN